MGSKEVIIAPEYKEANYPLVFLAGPIQGADDWQAQAIDTLHTLDSSITIASPRRTVWENPETFNHGEQVDWETHHLREAGMHGVIIFWLAKQSELTKHRAYAQTTRAELFEWKEKHIHSGAGLVLGIEPGFSGERYIRRRFEQDCPDIPIHTTLQDTCEYAVAMLQTS